MSQPMCQLCRTRRNLLDRIERVSDTLCAVVISKGNSANGRRESIALRRSLDSLVGAFKDLGNSAETDCVTVSQSTDTIDGPECDTDASENHGLDVTHEHGDTEWPTCKSTQVIRRRRRVGFD